MLPFSKYQGAGNDFVMIDQRNTKWLSREDTQKIQLLCDRHFGIGADGLILLQTHPEYQYEMIYFNADGRESTMCGNGGRCFAAFAKHLGITANDFTFTAIDGLHDARLRTPATISGLEWVELQMIPVKSVQELPTDNYVLNTGSPHYVRFVSNSEAIDVETEGQAIRYSDRFDAEGINVNFVEIMPNTHLRIRTYERGVEGETLACGTGVTAAAIAAAQRMHLLPGRHELFFEAKGGDLSVRFVLTDEGYFDDIWLCGPAQRVFAGEIAYD